MRKADISTEEKQRLLRDLGPAPDFAPAFAAATACGVANIVG